MQVNLNPRKLVPTKINEYTVHVLPKVSSLKASKVSFNVANKEAKEIKHRDNDNY